MSDFYKRSQLLSWKLILLCVIAGMERLVHVDSRIVLAFSAELYSVSIPESADGKIQQHQKVIAEEKPRNHIQQFLRFIFNLTNKFDISAAFAKHTVCDATNG